MLPAFHGIDLLIPLALAVLILGPKKLPEIGAAIGKTFKEYRKGMHELEATAEEAPKILPIPHEDVRESDPLRAGADKSDTASP
jgi:sec-independent protein translocase protein TatA